ncbi:MAG: mitochondrial fission ELM1 family protein [Geminicoccaceae bacterium]|nr:mitochondrial fission ELM1 family protein [Geminicoccaceae bacterium]MDW8369601.1 ELM1/GtrOC1 family putative glycosyltransferase [Geminicoccaceae bacterium]
MRVLAPSPPVCASPPRIWLLLGDKPGDNAQVLELARALGEPFLIKRLIPRPEWALGKPRFRPTLEHLDPARSDPLEPPWPELVLTIGRRPSMAALWLQEQSAGRTRLAIVGRPKRWPERFALILAPAQYAVPEAANVVRLELPLLRPDPERLEAAAARWRERLSALPRPLTAVLIGGETKPYRLDVAVARRLARELATLRAREGGTLWVTTSRRTAPAVADALEAALPPGTPFYRWRAEDPPEANPYPGLLALADRFVVTGDSVSMLVEVARLGRPLAIFPLPVRTDPATSLRRAVGRALAPEGPAAALGDLGRRLGLFGFPRELERIHRLLFESGRAVRLGEPFPPPGSPPPDELDRAVARLRALLDGSGPAGEETAASDGG